MLTAAVIFSAGCKKEPVNGENNGNDAADTLLYTIGVAAVPSNGGSVSGGGEYKPGQSCTVTASAADGYAFSDWTEHGSLVSTDATLIVMGITEAVVFPTIPVKVTINEYVEISKYYSTPNSRIFVNGILDRIIQEKVREGEIVKQGRGLFEN